MKRVKTQRFCVYCGGKGLTKEHIYGKWLSEYLDVPKKSTSHEIKIVHNNHVYINKNAKVARKNRDFFLLTLRIACKTCNETWMSEIQEASMKPMKKLFNKELDKIHRNDIKKISNWCLLNSISSQYTMDNIETVNFEERRNFMHGNINNNQWGVWIGKIEPNTFWGKGGAMYRPFCSIENDRKIPISHISCLGVNGYIFFVFKWHEKIPSYANLFLKDNGLIRIFPERRGTSLTGLSEITNIHFIDLLAAFSSALTGNTAPMRAAYPMKCLDITR